jgi:hypothetical protein
MTEKTIWKNQYEIIKENLNIIILLPTIFGGIWQLLELSSISSSFIRFFSLSQLIADGLLILFLLTILYISIKLSKYIIKTEVKKNINNPNSNSLIAGIKDLAILIILTIFFLIPTALKIHESGKIGVFEIFFLIPFYFFLIVFFFIKAINIIVYIFNKYPKLEKKFYSALGKTEPYASSILIIIITLFLKFTFTYVALYISKIRKFILFPDNLINREILELKIIRDYGLELKPRMIYNNDKFFFYEIYDSEKNKKFLIIDYSNLTDL